MKRWMLTLILGLMGALALAQGAKDVYSTSSCMGCHGQSAMGGFGPPIAKTKLTPEEVFKIAREGKGMMPKTDQAMLSDADLQAVIGELQQKPYDETQIPVAFRVSSALTTKGVSHIFLFVFGLAAVMALYRLGAWFRCAAFAPLWPYVVKYGLGRAVGVVLKSLVVDGLFVVSLWKCNKARWLMHGFMLYGFIGLIVSDILMAVFNPTRSDLALTHPLKALPMVSGLLLLYGVCYVMYRYRQDPWIDNGLTLGADFLFVNLLFHTSLAGFLTYVVNAAGLHGWVLTVYIYHLVAVALLILTGPFSRFQHVWVVPIMAAMTRLTEAVTASGVDLGFEREPSPGRHHKSERIAADVLANLGPDFSSDDFKMRYYP